MIYLFDKSNFNTYGNSETLLFLQQYNFMLQKIRTVQLKFLVSDGFRRGAADVYRYFSPAFKLTITIFVHPRLSKYYTGVAEITSV